MKILPKKIVWKGDSLSSRKSVGGEFENALAQSLFEFNAAIMQREIVAVTMTMSNLAMLLKVADEKMIDFSTALLDCREIHTKTGNTHNGHEVVNIVFIGEDKYPMFGADTLFSIESGDATRAYAHYATLH